MAKTKAQKHKAKRKEKQKQRRIKNSLAFQKEKADFLFNESLWLRDQEKFEEALSYAEKALRLDPKNKEMLHEMGYLGYRMNRTDVELKALLALYDNGFIKNEQMPGLCILLEKEGKYEHALSIAEETLPLISKMKIRNKKTTRADILQIQKYCKLAASQALPPGKRERYGQGSKRTDREKTPPRIPESVEASAPPKKETYPEFRTNPASLPEIPVSIKLNSPAFEQALANGQFTSLERYELTLEGYQIRFKESFENLICFNNIKNVRSLWYQEETARKVLKSFRGRALLSDEVGLGKTIEALIVFKEYIQRGMVKSALILTPTPLVSQWQGELKTKFGLDIPSTDDPDYRMKGASFWKEPFVLASINLAKSKNNFSVVTEREYDMVIVDEAHHLKNRNTLNWKLVNALKKRFLLLLTATPVENNLMELYNLVTLLKPGQLKTALEFRKEFMTRGDPTDPQNRSKLKELLGQVMIRNTRALAKIDIPPRFAQTIKLDPDKNENELYERISVLVQNINKTNGTGHKLLLKNLLEEAGSSPRAVSLTLSRVLAKNDLLLEQEKEIRAINNLCRSLDHTRKNKFLLKLIRSSPGKKIIFVKYLGTLDHISDFLSWEEIPHALFHGSMDNRKKDEQIKSFRKDKDVLVTTEIGGEGRNLQFCHQMVNYDLPWNPMKIEQRIGRIHRIGQEKEVMIYNLCATGSVEDYILEVLDKKINMFEMVIGEIDMIMGRVKGEQEFSDMVYSIWINSSSEKERQKSFDQLATRLKSSKTLYKKTKELDEKLFGENYEL
ncbi:MAG: SNF2-related protein [Deltaproteobacteria bacterium]|jgi:SNF2 family DNA or RNA helicase|nr:SNF2-related protein [Deltaproteobacteria bacterium]MDL1987207.1 SNF2-related protein [Deltaproteobacteria bacterium]